MNAPQRFDMVLSRKSLVIIGAIAVLLAGLTAGWWWLMHPPPAWVIRWQVTRYLKTHSTSGGFHVEFPFPSKAEMAAGPVEQSTGAELVKGSRTGKDFDALASQYLQQQLALINLEREVAEGSATLKNLKPVAVRMSQQLTNGLASGSTNAVRLQEQLSNIQKRIAALEKTVAQAPQIEPRQKALVPVTADLWDFQRSWAEQPDNFASAGVVADAATRLIEQSERQIVDAGSYEAIYKEVGKQIWVSQRLLESSRTVHHLIALRLLLASCRFALDDAQNGWLAGRIVEGYIWPNIHVANQVRRRSSLAYESVVEQCANIFRQNEDWANVARNYQLLLANPRMPQRADFARWQISVAHEQIGEFKEALATLRQIKATNDFRGFTGRIRRIEQQIKARS